MFKQFPFTLSAPLSQPLAQASAPRAAHTTARSRPAASEPTNLQEAATCVRSMFEQHRSFVMGSLRVLGVFGADLEDAAQEVFLVVFRRLADYEERGRARTWLYSICLRVAWSRRRASLQQREELGVEFPETAYGPTQHDRLADLEALRLGRALLAALPIEQRQVFWLYEVEECSMPEIARMLGCPLQTAYSRLHAARDRILVAVQRAQTDADCTQSLSGG
jgi:RNA polymerase sigma-70 factor, ECF subfamily